MRERWGGREQGFCDEKGWERYEQGSVCKNVFTSLPHVAMCSVVNEKKYPAISGR